jgi:hypothetical protein
MIKHNQDGAINALLFPLILTSVFLVGALGFGVWANSGRQDYKNNVDQKIADALTVALQAEDTKKDKAFAEQEKNPLRTFTGPGAYGSVTILYPKTWSAYVDTTSTSNALVDGYFYPAVVPSISNPASIFALRLQVVGQSYAESLQSLASAQQDGGITVTPFTLPKVPKQIGVMAKGTFGDGKPGVKVYLPLRDKTLIFSTDGNDFQPDFSKIILPNATFSP